MTDPSEDYTVDGARSSDTITVTITANQVNENPSVTGTAEFVIDQGMNLPDADQAGAATYMAEDPDAQTNINWVLEGRTHATFGWRGRMRARSSSRATQTTRCPMTTTGTTSTW